MSLPMEVKVKCGVCKHKSLQTVMASSNAFGEPDLDLRPPEMLRSTISWWIQECPYCGYVAPELSDTTSVEKAWLSSEKYRRTDSITFQSDLAGKFYKHYLICMNDGKTEDAFYAILHCAWACDDEDDIENAMECRKKALPLLDLLIKENPNDESKVVLKLDILRRAGLFDRVMEEYNGISFSDERLNRILAFQIDRARHRDIDCYTTGDVRRE